MSKHSPTDRLLQILIIPGQTPEALSTKELPLTLEQPLSSVYRYLKILLRWGLIEEQASQGRYLLGSTCLQLVKKLDREAPPIGFARPELKRLTNLGQESVALMVASNQQAVYLELFDSPQSLRCCYQKGLAQPLLHGASAEALLAHLEDERREELYLAQEFSAERINKLKQELRLIREQGYAVGQGKIGGGVWGIGVPPLDSRRRLHGVLSLMILTLCIQLHGECLRQWTLDAVVRFFARLDWPTGVSMCPASDMSLWQGRIDSQEGVDARCWH